MKGEKVSSGVTKTGLSSWELTEGCLPGWNGWFSLLYFSIMDHTHTLKAGNILVVSACKSCVCLSMCVTYSVWLERYWKKTNSSRQRVWWHRGAVYSDEAGKTEFPTTHNMSAFPLVCLRSCADILDLWQRLEFIQHTVSQSRPVTVPL